MTFKNKDEYIKYRLSKAWETLESAKLLAERKYLTGVINRLYYSAFYAVNALLLTKNIKTKTHDGTHSQFNLNFIKNSILPTTHGFIFNKLFDYRLAGDYNDFYEFDEDEVFELIRPTENLIIEIEKLIREDISLD